jgi:hypothetical protein
MLFVPERRRSSRLQSAIRAAMFAPPSCRRSRRKASRTELVRRYSRRIRRRRRLPGEHPASGASHSTERAQRAEQSNGAPDQLLR